MWISYLQEYFERYDYPKEGADALLDTMRKISGDTALFDTLQQCVTAYEQGAIRTQQDVEARLSSIREAAQQQDIPTETAELLFFLMCMKHLKTLYDHFGLPERYYAGVASDLRSKLNECFAVKGIWGSFVALWFAGFFAMTRFVIGRLQYEIIQMPGYMSPDGKHCFHGQTAVNMHIPSGRPLLAEEVSASMAEAALFFAKDFPEGKILFHCSSWLLYPGNYQMLPETSGIRRFMDLFTIIRVDVHSDRHDLWRLFDTMAVDDLDQLPQNTSLRRSYVQWLKEGKPVGSAVGICYYPIPN